MADHEQLPEILDQVIQNDLILAQGAGNVSKLSPSIDRTLDE